MITARVRPLITLLFLCGAVLVARLYQVQVTQHPVWAGEAVKLVHTGREVPYRRGSVLDAANRPLVEDVLTQGVYLEYRTFRREHPLGQVTHAVSLLSPGPVNVADAQANLAAWAHDLVQLTPGALEAYGRGEAFLSPGWQGPAIEGPERENRAGRARDLAYYLRKLLDWEDRRLGRMRERTEAHPDRTFLELTAEDRGTTVEEEWQRLAQRLERSSQRLARLSEFFEWPEDDGELRAPLERLIAELEHARRWVEDASASKLFAEAAGFAPGRVAPELLRDFIDLEWIHRLLYWDDRRTAEWIETTRGGWTTGWRDGFALPRLVAALLLDPAREPDAMAFLEHVSVVFQPRRRLEQAIDFGPLPWRGIERLAVLEDLDTMLAADLEEDREAARPLPLQSPELRAFEDGRAGLVEACIPTPPEGLTEGVEAWLTAALERRYQRDFDELITLARQLAHDWDASFQEAVRERLEALRAAARPQELSPAGKLMVAREGRIRAAERAAYYLKDFGTRPRVLFEGEPSPEVVLFLTRYEDDFKGFEVRDVRRREARAFDDGQGADLHPAEVLLGNVSAVTVTDMVRQRMDAQRLRVLKSHPDRSEIEREELIELVGEVVLHDEVKGVAGVEGFFESELSGTNGYREAIGLQDVYGRGREDVQLRKPVDGEDVQLTLDADLQRAAQRTLRFPEPPRDDDYDRVWYGNPVGSIVLLSIEGDVLAASSEPDDQSSLGVDARHQRSIRGERSLRKPTFQPPGSVFKAFVAAYALEHGLDPHVTVNCTRLPGEANANYKDLRCWKRDGHGEVDLEAALVGSCNSYFAWLGETLSAYDLHQLAKEFGFGQPTGVWSAPPWATAVERPGFLEDTAGIAMRRGRPLDFALSADRRRAGNGLSVVEATPMQVARGILAVATGELRTLRLVQRIGEREFPRAPGRPLHIASDHLDFVRQALQQVVQGRDGTAHRALRPDKLGLTVAVKTGSADLTGRGEDGEKVRKHTWVAGWVPAQDPVAAFVVFVHDTDRTSSHGAVYLAEQFLQQPEMYAWLARQGVDVSNVPIGR